MSQPVEIQAKVERLDEDVQAIYELLGEIRKGQQAQDKVLEDHGRQLTQTSGTQQRQYDRLEQVSYVGIRLTRQVDEIKKTHDRHGSCLDGIDIRLDRVDRNLAMIVGDPETEQARRPSPQAEAPCE